MANNVAVTAAGIVGLTWSAATSDGGSPVIDYQVSYMPAGGTYSVLAPGIATTSFTASTLTADVVYSFKVTARNLIGLGADSNEVIVRAAAKPSIPAAPVTSVNSNTSVTITWVAPADGGSSITGYSVAIRQSDGTTFSTESANCNVSTITCTVPISILQAAPYNLAWGASIYATVIATNVAGSSAASPSGNGAVIATNPIVPSAPTTTVNSNTSVTINWVAPADGGSVITAYTVAIQQSNGSTFTTESANCNVSTTTCTVPISILQAAPYNLAWGASIYATVIATNCCCSSAASPSGNGAFITTTPDPPSLLSNDQANTFDY